MIYFAIFDSYLSYFSLVWVQNCNTIQQNLFEQKMTVRIVNIQPIFSHNLSSSVFNNWFSFYSDQYETSSSIQRNFIKLSYKTNRHGKYSRTFSAVKLWKIILQNMLLKDLFSNKIKTFVSKFYLNFNLDHAKI